MFLAQQTYLIGALRTLGGRARRAISAGDERGAIPAEVAWIAGIVVIALAVLVILLATTTTKANNIKLQ